MLEADVLDGHARGFQLAAQPAFAVGRQERDGRAAAVVKLTCELRDHPLGSAGSV